MIRYGADGLFDDALDGYKDPHVIRILGRVCQP
jgi:hypothetical protein